MKKIHFLFIFILSLCFSKIEAQNFHEGHYRFKSSVDSIAIKIEFYSPKIVRVLKFPEGVTLDKKSLSVIKNPEKCDLRVSKGENNLIISSDKMKVVLDHNSGRIEFLPVRNSLLEQ